jgi:hypothetical protein
VVWRELAQVDRYRRAERHSDQQRDHRGRQRACDQRHDSVVRIREQRRPQRVGQEFDDRHVLEERARLDQQNRDDGERREHRNQPGCQQHPLDDAIAHLAIAQSAAGDGGSRCRRGHFIFSSVCSSSRCAL